MTQQTELSPNSNLLIRSYLPMPDLISSIKEVVSAMDPSIVLNFSVFRTQIRDGLVRDRMMATLSDFFGATAALLAMIGLYGVVSYIMTRRRGEIGIRIALGATRKGILAMVLREIALLLTAGIAIGLVLAFFAGRAAASMLYGLKPHDPAILMLAACSLAVMAFLLALLPARRAAAVDPMVVLREE